MVTRRALASEALLPLNLIGSTVVAGRGSKGRGAYVAVERDALRGLNDRVLSRAFRSGVSGFDVDEFLEQTHAAAERKVLERIGLARRSGGLVVGIEAVAKASAKATVILAADLSGRSAAKIEGFEFLTGEALGASAGMGWIGALAIQPQQLAQDASYWLRVWYESALEAKEASREGTDE
ncbi:MAG: hypothetical protein AAF654_00190 [Myxococcota bacterium]